MIGKIDRAWSSLFGQGVSRKNEVQDREGSPQNQADQQDAQGEQDQSQQQADRQMVEKALAETTQDGQMGELGLKLDIIENNRQISVELRDQSGHLIRTISGEDFLKLRRQSKADVQTRGKILDQKF